MSWLNDYLEKVGLGEIVTLHKNSPEAPPEGFDLEKAANDYFENRKKIWQSSDEFKNFGKEQRIMALKEFKKKANDAVGLGLSGEEAGTLDPEEFLTKIKTKFESDLEAAKNGRTSEWQEKYGSLEKEFNGFKKKYEQDAESWKKQYEEAVTKSEREAREAKRNALFSETFTKLDFGSDQAHKENAKIIVQTVMGQRGINYREDGTVFKGENDVVTTDDGHTIIKDLEGAIKYIASERKLFPQANNGGQQPQQGQTPIKPSGDPKIDALIQQQLSEVDRVLSLK